MREIALKEEEPDALGSGTVVETPVSTLDVLPTVAAGGRAPIWRAGDYKAVRKGEWNLQVDGRQGKQWLSNVVRDVTEIEDLSLANRESVEELKEALRQAEEEFVARCGRPPSTPHS
ncbi:MAG: hypothetical protein VYE73_01350 [Acidobacteriota bacterium]|nr:hypothetical protein [Acidobacteriota bacterium]